MWWIHQDWKLVGRFNTTGLDLCGVHHLAREQQLHEQSNLKALLARSQLAWFAQNTKINKIYNCSTQTQTIAVRTGLDDETWWPVHQLGSKTPRASVSRPYLGFGAPPFRNTCTEKNNKGVTRQSYEWKIWWKWKIQIINISKTDWSTTLAIIERKKTGLMTNHDRTGHSSVWT